MTQSKNFFSGLGDMFNKKKQHVVINEADLENAKTELRNRVQAVLGGLLQCGIQGLPLDTQELIELYYDTYNPDTATRQQLKNFDDLTADIITKGRGQRAAGSPAKGAAVMAMAKTKQASIRLLSPRRSSCAKRQEVRPPFKRVLRRYVTLLRQVRLNLAAAYFQLGTRYARTYYVYGYPRQLYTGWLCSMVNLDEVIDMSMYIYPVESQVVLENLRKKVTQLEAGIQIDAEKGRVRDPGKQAAILDAEEMRDKLQVGEERFFRFGLYFTIYANSVEELEFVVHKVESMLGQQLVYSKPATSQQEQGLNSTVPQLIDQLQIRRNMSTGALSTSFPFTSADLTQENGILYGINMHNSGLVIFDRFSLENGNSVVFAKSGAGKSFTVSSKPCAA